LGRRASTIDVDIHIVPDDDCLLRALPELKEDLEMNVELACPAHFINLKPAKQIRLTIPQSVLFRADKVIKE
jgi:hypothetical protein